MVSAAKPASKAVTVRAVNQGGERTRERILDAAEQLFSGHGLDGVSMRQIAARAKAPLALANYHFDSKEGLYRAVLQRRAMLVSSERRALLARAFARHAKPPIEDIFEALARPWVELRGRPGGLAYTRLVARETGDPAEGRRGIVRELLDPIALDFIAAMERALPDHSRARVNWAYHFFIGALLLILANPDRLKRLSGQVCDFESERAVIREIVTFFSAALAQSGPRPRAVRKTTGVASGAKSKRSKA